jgi:hypothetical protein
MSRGIIQAALENHKMFSRLDARELSLQDEFACLLRLLSAGESA